MRTTMVARRSTGGVHERKLTTEPPPDQESSGYSSSEHEDGAEDEFDDELEQLAAATFVDIKSRLTKSTADSDQSSDESDSNQSDKDEEEQGPSHCSGELTHAAPSCGEPSYTSQGGDAAQFIIDKTPGLSRSFDSSTFCPEIVGQRSRSSDSSCDNDSPESDSDGSSSDRHLSKSKAGTSTASASAKPKRKRGWHKQEKKKDLNESLGLSSSLDSGLDPADVYVSADFGVTRLGGTTISGLQMNKDRSEVILKKSVVGPDFEKRDQIPPYQESLNQIKKQRKLDRDKTKGKGWFDLPAQEMTEEKKNDLMVLQMRRALDPKQFYKGRDMRGLPKYFQVGRVVETAADFYHSRIPKKQRKSTLVDELLADAEFRKYNKRKYTEIMETKHPSNQGALRHMKRLKKKKK